MKVYINGEGHMTKMAVMAINSKKPLFLFYVLVYNFFCAVGALCMFSYF